MSSPTSKSAKSRFSFRHLALASCRAPPRDSPLRVIAHIDLDAFYSQVELVRLQLSPDTPLAVQQWQGIIAVNYPARAFGVNRHDNVDSALIKCPHLVLQHVQTWKEGEMKPQYHQNPDISTHKVSLDPYRQEGRKILDIFRQHCDTIEKASIDESFFDLTSSVKQRLLEKYPFLASPPDGDLSCCLPLPSTCDWTEDHGILVSLSPEESETDPPDWDDVCMHLGAEIIREIRLHVWEELKYTCSAGVGKNKMLAKLCSAYRKPNQQTVLRNRAVMGFLANLKFTKIRNLGGKLGERVCETLNADLCRDIWKFSMDELREKLGLETGSLVYSISRGYDYSMVNPIIQIKSMSSAKNFRPSIEDIEQAVQSHLGINGPLKSRQTSIPIGKELTAGYMSFLAVGLMKLFESESSCYPCTMLSVGLLGFEGLEDGVRDITVCTLWTPLLRRLLVEPSPTPVKKAKKQGIDKFFKLQTDTVNYNTTDLRNESTGDTLPSSTDDLYFLCSECNGKLIPVIEQDEHKDWHFALNLSNKEKVQSRSNFKSSLEVKSSKQKTGSEDKGQRRLQFC